MCEKKAEMSEIFQQNSFVCRFFFWSRVDENICDAYCK